MAISLSYTRVSYTSLMKCEVIILPTRVLLKASHYLI